MNNVENDAYNIGINKPFSSSGDIIGTVRSSNGSIVTSGTYERYFESDGRLYHHILNPSTGYPFETDLSSATVISASSMEGDVLSTILLSEGMQKAVKRADELKKNKIYVILIDDDGDVIYDSGSYILN
jgi:thiamine biosynthesis lipoprotein